MAPQFRKLLWQRLLCATAALLLTAGFTGKLFAQIINPAPRIVEFASFGGTTNDSCQAVVHDVDGAIFIAGLITAPAQFGSKVVAGNSYFIARLDPNLNVVWEHTFPHTRDLFTSKVSLVISDDSIVLLAGGNGEIGLPDGVIAGTVVVAFAKADGGYQWGQSINPVGLLPTSRLSIDPFQNIIVAVEQLGSEHGSYLLKISPTGQRLWTKLIPFVIHGCLTDVRGNIYTYGRYSVETIIEGQWLTKTNQTSGVLARFSPEGTFHLAHGYSSGYANEFVDGTYDPATGVLLMGNVRSPNALSNQPFLIKHSAERGFEGRFNLTPTLSSTLNISRLARLNGELYLTGRTTSNARSTNQILNTTFVSEGRLGYVVSLDRSFNVRWLKGMRNVRLESLTVGSQGGLLLAGAFNQNFYADGVFALSFGDDGFVATLAPENPPTIQVQPKPVIVSEGRTATISITASGTAALAYQWYFKDQKLTGQTNATLTLNQVSATQAGLYYVEVSSGGSVVRSDPAVLTVRPYEQITVRTIAGNGQPGYLDATNGAGALLDGPNGPVVMPDGGIMFADGNNHAIRGISPSGAVATYAGTNSPGFVNGPADRAQFNFPLGLAYNSTLGFLVADYGNQVIRRIDALGSTEVSTHAGTGGIGYLDGPRARARFNSPNDLVTDAAGNIYLTEFANHTIRKITVDGTVTTLAGNGVASYADGAGTNARFNGPAGLTMGTDGNLYVTEWNNHRVRRVTMSGIVTTVVGTNAPGFQDGFGAAARLNIPDGIATDPQGNLYITEQGNHAIRKITPLGEVTTLAGLGAAGFANGRPDIASFRNPSGIAWHPAGSLIVTDAGNHAIRRIDWITNTSPTVTIALLPALTIYGTVGKAYRIEALDRLAAGTPPAWTTLATITLTNAVQTWIDFQPALAAQRVYRATLVE